MGQKRVVLKITEPRFVQIDDVSNEKIYAAYSSFSATSKMEIIIICRLNDGLYRAVPLSSYYPQHYSYENSLKGMLKIMLKDGLAVYEFDSEADFAQWMVDDNS
jgi:hypothetical protein